MFFLCSNMVASFLFADNVTNATLLLVRVHIPTLDACASPLFLKT